jgi:uridine monophosphate synthetase
MMSGAMTERQRKFADALLESGAVRFGAFRLKLHERQPDAPLAPIYVNLRAPQSFPDAMDAMVAALRELIEARGLVFSRYAGIPMAATPMTAVLSHLTRIPMITPREPKTHGLASTIDGTYLPGETVLVLDDLVTHAESKLEAIHVLEGAGLVVRDIAVLIDREQGGAAQLAQAGYTLHAAVTLRQLLDYWRAVDGITEQTYTTVRAYLDTQT